MNNTILNITESIPSMLKHTHLNVNLTGWPAVACIGILCGSCLSAYALYITHEYSNENPESSQSSDSNDLPPSDSSQMQEEHVK